MTSDFFEDVSAFVARLKKESRQFKGNTPFETLMRGLSDGSVDFRWGLGGRLMPHLEPLQKPDLLMLRYLISAPIIYAMVFPILLLDISVSVYQALCFRLWKIPQISRKRYVIIDRHRLEYLNLFQKLNCFYCGYANGVMAYARMIAGETERYWCPVKHEQEVPAPHNFYLEFAEYNDVDGWDRLHSEGMENWDNGANSPSWNNAD